jgi:lipopolysaccharide/colanic/teichoic acid biosynthesis glycosyltransferase
LMAKRVFDLLLSAMGMLLLIPVFIIIAVVIKLDSKGPIFFRQERVGQYGCPFRIHKFRTMLVDSEARGLQLTAGADPRITRIGQLLRKYKLDELPQLIDVIKGDMSLVGPRPEVPRYVALYPENAKQLIFRLKPGITDSASIEFRNENQLLATSANPERDYIEKILPRKIEYYCQYVAKRSLWGDLILILRTILSVLKVVK